MREQRKVVTVLFCDLVGSTALGESTDPEALRARMRRYFEDLRAILERHGGAVEKFVGDAVMAVFGIPTAHEDDALRAVRAAWEMREAIAEHGLEARIGINTGEVVVGGEGETLVTGDAVNVAARLEQAAPARRGHDRRRNETSRPRRRARRGRRRRWSSRESRSRSRRTGFSTSLARRGARRAPPRHACSSAASGSERGSGASTRTQSPTARASCSRFSALPGSASRAS